MLLLSFALRESGGGDRLWWSFFFLSLSLARFLLADANQRCTFCCCCCCCCCCCWPRARSGCTRSSHCTRTRTHARTHTSDLAEGPTRTGGLFVEKILSAPPPSSPVPPVPMPMSATATASAAAAATTTAPPPPPLALKGAERRLAARSAASRVRLAAREGARAWGWRSGCSARERARP